MINKILEHYSERERKERTHHYPSDAYSCPRKLCYSWLGEKKTNAPSIVNLIKMDMGNAVHEGIGKLLGGEEEVAFRMAIPSLKHEVSGRIDRVIKGVPVEIKSTFLTGFKWQEDNGIKEDYLAQVWWYNKHLQTNKGWIIVIARDSGNILEVRYEWDSLKNGTATAKCEQRNLFGNEIGSPFVYERNITMSKYIKNLEAVEGAIEKKEILPGAYKVWVKDGVIRDKLQVKGEKLKSDWQCIYCDYKDKCKKITNKEDIYQL